MTTETVIIIKIEDWEINNFYPNAKETVTITCRELGYNESLEFRSGKWEERQNFVKTAINELCLRLKKKFGA